MIRLRDNMSRFLGKSKDNKETKINVEKNLVELKKLIMLQREIIR